ncbi:hypothetical protein DFP73DRAFT_359606 [Morchella snyderi]|nr:hypothetical protein DFP73DRAFT_359606 [Morchella snyderi]
MSDGLLLLSSPASSHFPHSHPHEADPFHMTSTKTDPPASLKRTYTLVSRSNPPSPSDPQDNYNPNPFKVQALGPSRLSPRHMSLSLKRRYPFCKSPTAPTIITSTGTGTSSSPTVPSFVSIFDIDVDMSGCSPTSLHSQHTIVQKGPNSCLLEDSIGPLQRCQTGSLSTSASSSTNSSPTTTISTLGSAITEDHTPESSPDSLVSAMPLSALRSKSEDLGVVPQSPLPGYTRSLSPSKKPRNTKNLSLKPLSVVTSPVQAVGDSNNIVNQSPRSMSAPTSPAFIRPPPPPQNPRRRPSNLGLTIKLPGALPEKTAVQGPPAGGITALRHHQSSPSLFSPAHGGVPGGMKLPPTPGFQRPSRLFSPPRPSLSTFTAQDSLSSSLSSSSISNSPPKSPDVLHEMEEEDEEPRSGEAKSPAYPSGPVCIFEPNIYLYAEPDAELASKFDLIVNVAREVLNPFSEGVRGPVSARFGGFESGTMPPDTACTEASFTTAFEEALFSPLKTSGRLRPNEPEYVHMPWDHNTPILDDLPHLVNLIDDRASSGKKVLVHCQCGVSRSATLLIAYSMFKNPGKSMQEAYAAVKGKSRWIGPNMGLIYQLTDWKKKIDNDGTRPGNGGWRMGSQSSGGVRGLVLKSGNRNGFGRAGTMDEERESESMPEPQTAPLPEMRKTPSPPPPSKTRDHPIPAMVRTRSENGGFISGVSPGPSSAPPGMISIPGTESGPSNMRQSWPDSDSIDCVRGRSESPRADSPPPSWAEAARELEKEEVGVSATGFVPQPIPPSAAYLVQRAEKEIFGRTTAVGNEDDDPPPTPGGTFMSPRNSAYFGAPIRRSGGFFFADPRSPTQRGGEPPIVRSIFDVL